MVDLVVVNVVAEAVKQALKRDYPTAEFSSGFIGIVATATTAAIMEKYELVRRDKGLG